MAIKDGNYHRKSISSPDSVLFFASNKADIFPLNEVKEILSNALELKRFDKNTLPSELTESFYNEIYQSVQRTEKNIAQAIQRIYSQEIKKILDNPNVQKARIDQFKEKKTFTFEFGKGKSYSITASDLKQLYQSSFFYVPYINSVQYEKRNIIKIEDDEEKKLKEGHYWVEGGVLWYQVVVSGNQQVFCQYIGHNKQKSQAEKTVERHDDDGELKRSLIQEALKKWSNELAYQVKKMPQFTLHGYIEQSDKNQYQLSVYQTEGVQLDNLFWLMENTEDGLKTKANKTGLVYINKIGDQLQRQPRYSKATQIYGNNQALSSWVLEAPRKGIEIGMFINQKTNFIIDPQDSMINGQALFKKKITSALSLNTIISMDISSILKSPQQYLELDMSISPVFPELNSGGVPYLVDVYGIYRKKRWIKQVGYQVFAGVGQHVFYIDKGDTFKYFQLDSLNIKSGVAIEKMVVPFFLLRATLYATVSLGMPRVSYKSDFGDNVFNASYSRLNWIGASVGVNWMK